VTLSKFPSKKATSKKPIVIVKKARKAEALHDKLIKLFTRLNGATLTDTVGFKCPAMAALKIAERRGYKVTTNKVPGELTRYIARKA